MEFSLKDRVETGKTSLSSKTRIRREVAEDSASTTDVAEGLGTIGKDRKGWTRRGSETRLPEGNRRRIREILGKKRVKDRGGRETGKIMNAGFKEKEREVRRKKATFSVKG